MNDTKNEQIGDVAKLFWAYLEKRGYAKTTINNIVAHYKRAARFTGETFPGTEALERNYNNMLAHGRKPNTLMDEVKFHKKWAAFANVDRPKIRAPPSGEGRIDYLNEIEIKKLLFSVDNFRDDTLIHIILYGGLRRTEAARLRPDDLSIGEGLLHVETSKNRTDHYIPLHEKAIEAVLKWRERLPAEAEWLFPNGRGGHLEPQRITRIVRRYGRVAGISRPVTPHILRHTLATQMLKNGADITTVQRQLRHRDIASTLRYVHISHEGQKALYERVVPF